MTRRTNTKGIRVLSLGLGASLCLGSAPIVEGAVSVTDYESRYASAYLCDNTDEPTWPSDECCSEFDAACGTGDVSTVRPNILLVVSDDQDYCLYGFMAGVCSKKYNGAFVSCLSEDACDAGGGRCVGSRDLGTCSTGEICYLDADCPSGTCNRAAPPTGSAAPPLRLNDLACRNRQARRPKKADEFKWCDSNDGYEQKLHRKQLWFSREGAPCRRGTNGTTPTPPEAYPAAFTPHLDALATHGAVFPRAYVAGIICKNSRRAMLHGRYLRHLQWLWEGGGGTYECKRSSAAEPRKGCYREEAASSECPANRDCEAAHTVAWWLDSDTRSNVHLPTSNGYERFAFAKLDVMKAGRGGFAPKGHGGSKTGKGPGKIRCDETDTSTTCEAVLTAADPEALNAGGSGPPYPTAEVFDVPGRSHYELTDAIDPVMTATGAGAYTQDQPFFIWWGPHIPHAGPKADDFLHALYDADNMHKVARAHYARASWLDASLGGIIYHLRRACRCDGDTAASLWKHTVVVFLSDQGWLLPRAKGNTHEATQRTPLIISTPEMRAATPQHVGVYEEEMASSVDLVPTILAYAGDGTNAVDYYSWETNAAEYPLGRDLKNWIETSDPQSWDRRRNLTFGEDLRASGEGDKEPRNPVPRHIVTRPGLFGVCQYPYNFSKANDTTWDPTSTSACGDTEECHVHPCLTTADCANFGTNGNKSLGYCVDADDATTEQDNPDSRWNRCVNRPWVRCDDDGDCADPDWCPAGTCTFETTYASDRVGSYNDLTGLDCSQNGEADCLPPGVCKPLLLKVQWEAGSAEIPAKIWDLDWDPDERTSLVKQSPPAYPYLKNFTQSGDDLGTKLADCMKHFLDQATTNYYEWEGDNASPQCPTDLIDWTVPSP